MSENKEDFALHCLVKNEEARKRLGIKAGFFWTTAKKLSVAISRCIAAMDDKGYDEDDFKKPVRVNLPAIGDLPPEGVFDTEFCNRYEKGGEDGKTMMLIPGAVPADQFHEQMAADDDASSDTASMDTPADSDNTAGDPLPAYAYNVNGEPMADVEKSMFHPVATLSERHRILSQFILEDKFSRQITPEQLAEVSRMELEMSDNYIQDMLLACHNVPGIQKLDTPGLWKFTDAFKRIFPRDKQRTLHMKINFAQAYADAHPIDRGLLVKEWQKGNRVSSINRTPSGANAGGGNKTDRNPDYEHTLNTLDVEIAMATLPMDFNIYELPGSVYRRAKEIVKKKESPFKEWSAALRATPGILDYSRAAIFALIRSAHPEYYHYPGRLQGYINANLTETDHENPTEEALTAARHTPEKDAVEEANRQLAAARGEYVEGISDPNDPKWVKTGTSQPTTEPGDAVQAGEGDLGTGKEAVTVENQNQAETHQNNDSVSQSEPEAQQNVPESQQEEPEAAWPEYFEPGRYEGVPNDIYHAANGISSTMVKDARVSLMYYEGRHVSKTIKKERSKVLDMGNLVHVLALQPEILDAEFSIEPEIPEGALTTTATIRAVIDEYNASLTPQLSADEIKTLLEEYNSSLPAPVPLGGDKDAIGVAYLELPDDFKRIVGDDKNFTASTMKACIKEYNATLPPQVRTSGNRDA
ncbi:exodeoxyribonuclease, partial [Salmonella enterica]|nr:exodeoxyribonuclease [Salmonella enterica]